MTPKQFFNKDLKYGDKVEVCLSFGAPVNGKKYVGFYGGLHAWQGTIVNLEWDVFVNLKGTTKKGEMSNRGIFGSAWHARFPINAIKSIRKISQA